jgi:hypothetical protein
MFWIGGQVEVAAWVLFISATVANTPASSAVFIAQLLWGVEGSMLQVMFRRQLLLEVTVL